MTAVFDARTFTVTPPRRSPASCAGAETTPQDESRPFAENVRFSSYGVPPQSLRARGVKRLGLLYERRVLDVLSAIYGDSFVPQPMIYYTRHLREQRAIPDGLLYLKDQCFIIEVKLAHTSAVWPQLIERYLPLVSILHPRKKMRTVEICRSYDPAVAIPHTPITSLHRGSVPGLEVMRWRI